MKRPYPAICAAITATLLAFHAEASAATSDRLNEIKQSCLQRASVIKSVRYTLTEIGTRPLEGTIEYRKVDPKAIIIHPDKDFSERVALVRTRQGDEDAYEVTDYPIDGAKPTGQMRRTWDGESGKMLERPRPLRRNRNEIPRNLRIRTGEFWHRMPRATPR